MYRNAEEFALTVINDSKRRPITDDRVWLDREDLLMLARGYIEKTEKVNRIQAFIDYLKERSSQVHEVRTLFGRKQKYQDIAWADADRIQRELDGVEYRKEDYRER